MMTEFSGMLDYSDINRYIYIVSVKLAKKRVCNRKRPISLLCFVVV